MSVGLIPLNALAVTHHSGTAFIDTYSFLPHRIRKVQSSPQTPNSRHDASMHSTNVRCLSPPRGQPLLVTRNRGTQSWPYSPENDVTHAGALRARQDRERAAFRFFWAERFLACDLDRLWRRTRTEHDGGHKASADGLKEEPHVSRNAAAGGSQNCAICRPALPPRVSMQGCSHLTAERRRPVCIEGGNGS